MNRFIIHIVGGEQHTLSEPAHMFIRLPFDVSLKNAAQVARVLSIFPSIRRCSIRIDDQRPHPPFHEFPGIYVKGQYRHWQREGRV